MAKTPVITLTPLLLQYTECKYGGPLGRRPGRVMKVRLVRPRCFVLTMLPLKSLASWTG